MLLDIGCRRMQRKRRAEYAQSMAQGTAQFASLVRSECAELLSARRAVFETDEEARKAELALLSG